VVDTNKLFMLFFGITVGVAVGTLERMLQPYITYSMNGSSDAKILVVGVLIGFVAALYVMKFG
jgi:hypothetical protein